MKNISSFFFFSGENILSMFFLLSLHHKSASRGERERVIESLQFSKLGEKMIVFGFI